MVKIIKVFVFFLIIFNIQFMAQANEEELQVLALAQSQSQPTSSLVPAVDYDDPLKYVLGPDDVIQIDVMRHPEFSGTYPVNLEGKIQYKFVGDIEVAGMAKKDVEEKIRNIIANFVVSPEINVTVLEYKSKVIYILGEVSQPGKYYMRSGTLSVRDAVVQAGLPLQSAAMRKCRIITPTEEGKVKTRRVDLYSVLYGGNLKYNYDMCPGDVLYVPSTVMAKVLRVINPVASTIGVASSGPSDASRGKAAVNTLAK